MKRWSNAYIFGLVLMGPLAVWFAVGQSTFMQPEEWGEVQSAVISGSDVWVIQEHRTIQSVELVDGELVVAYVSKGNGSFSCSVLHPPGEPCTMGWRAWKEVYAAKEGQVVLDRTIEGSITPQRTIPEKIEWPE